MVFDRKALERWIEHFKELLSEDVNEFGKVGDVGAQTTDNGDHIVYYPVLKETQVAIGSLITTKLRDRITRLKNY